MKNILSLICALFLVLSHAQQRKTLRANDAFDQYAFVEAIASYEDLIDQGYSDENIFKKLGNANYTNAQYQNAAKWYEKLVKLQQTNIEPEYYYRYAQSLKSLGDYSNADQWMKKFKALKAKDQRAVKFLQQTDYLDKIKANSGRYSIKNVKINSSYSDFAPSFYKDRVVFATARDTGLLTSTIHEWNNASFLDLYQASVMEDAELSMPKKFSKRLNTKMHESSSVFNKAGTTVYFTRNNAKNGRFIRDGKGISRLKLYKAVFKNGKWSKAIKLPFNKNGYSIAHPALSEDEKTLYFASDMQGTLGASDLFKVAINDDGSYGEPQNLGDNINTEARESFPFVRDGVLYFSSDGHPGLGGLDVFATKIDAPDQSVVNLGEPLNSAQDDFSYIINTRSKGYFASNREGGKGSDDIYAFTENIPLNFECTSVLSGSVTDNDNLAPLHNVTVMLMQGEVMVSKTKTDAKGNFTFDIACNESTYIITTDKEGYHIGNKEVDIYSNKDKTVAISLKKSKSKLAQLGDDLLQFLNLGSINFGFDQYTLRAKEKTVLDKVAEYLKANPEAKIAIESHTDAKGTQDYNQKLSQKRADQTKNYLIAKGITINRIIAKGFGEEKLLNTCSPKNPCAAKQHAENRRSEIKIVP